MFILLERKFIDMKKAKSLIALVFCIFFFELTNQPAIACIEGLTWGMNLSSVETHLGVTLNPIDKDKAKDLYEVRDFKMSDIPVRSLRFYE